MSLQPQAIPPIPEETARVARAIFPSGNRYMRLRDELGVNHLIPRAESVQFCGRKRTHPFREERPYFSFVSASREM